MKILANDGISEKGIDLLSKAGHEVITVNVAQDQLINYINEQGISCLLVRSATQARKDLIDSINLDSLSLKDKVEEKIKPKDLQVIEKILDECSQYNYADISGKDNVKIKEKTIKILTRINGYV